MELSNKQELSNKHRRFLLLDQGAFGIIPNLIITILITLVLKRSESVIPIWGPKSICVDLITSAFVLPMLVCIIVIPQYVATAGERFREGFTVVLKSTENHYNA